MSPSTRTFLRNTLLLAAPMYVLSLLLTLPATGLLGRALDGFAGSSAFAEQLADGRVTLFLGEFIGNNLPLLGGLPATFLPLIPVYILLWVLAAGGIVTAFADPEVRPLPAFGAGTFRLGPRFLLLFLVMLPVYALLAWLFSLPALLLGTIAAGDSELAPIGFGILGALMAALGLAVGQVYHLSIKSVLALRPGPFWRSLLVPLSLRGQYWRRMLVAYLAVVIGGAAIIALLSAAAAGVGPAWVLAALLWQAGVFLHVAARVGLHGLFVAAVRRRLPAPPAAIETVAAAAIPAPSVEPELPVDVLSPPDRILPQDAGGQENPAVPAEPAADPGQTTAPPGT